MDKNILYEVFRDEHRRQTRLAGDLTYEEARNFEKQANADLAKEPDYRPYVMSRAIIGIRQQKIVDHV